MAILVTNDDGAQSAGLDALEQAAAGITAIRTFVPETNASGAGGSLSLFQKIKFYRKASHEYWVHGTPADAAYIGVHSGLYDDIDMVVSGINDGSNFSDDCYSSGTLGAAVQGRFLPKPPLAFSLATIVEPQHWGSAGAVARRLIRYFYTEISPFSMRGLALNINIPDRPEEDIKGVRFTRLGRRMQPGKCTWACDEPKRDRDAQCMGSVYIGERGKREGYATDSDFVAVEQGYVSITPVSLDMTDRMYVYDTHLGLEEKLSQTIKGG